MQFSRQARTILVLPATLLLCSLAGGVLGPQHAAAATNDNDSDIKASLKEFTKIYQVVEDNFADPVAPDKAIYKGAIPGMLRTLDPHSNFFDPKDYAQMREDQRGRYAGVGMEIGARNGHALVMFPFGGTPAYKAGLRPGDVLVSVNDKNVDGMSTSDIADLLRGPRGTPVQIVVRRDEVDHPITFNVIRDEIPRPSVMTPFWIQPGIAYVEISAFNDNTAQEMIDGLAKLGESNIKGLILDLRDNPGGLLTEGIGTASHFLQRGQTVVSQRGRSSPERPYYVRADNNGVNYPIVVLVNSHTASAAEIVAGALQDHDRAWILGDTTFGKGLVQTLFPLSENSGLALTTAHYYTPSGRLIQRDYSNISFLDYFYHHGATKNPHDVKMTDSGRTVYGGGGITPDEKWLPPKYNDFQINVLRKSALFDFSAQYFGPKQNPRLPAGWAPDEAVVNEFHDFLLKDGVPFTEAEFTDNHEWLKQELKREMYITAFSLEASQRVAVEDDPMIPVAVDALTKAAQLQATAKKMIVERMDRR
jgi:carboxyl-terminal processing protease